MTYYTTFLLALFLTLTTCRLARADQAPPVDAPPAAPALFAAATSTPSPIPQPRLELVPETTAAPASPVTEPLPKLRFRNRAMMIAGIVFTGIGTGALAGCIGVGVISATRPRDPNPDTGSSLGGLGLGLCPAIAALGVGIPLWAVGGQRVPERPSWKTSWSRPELLVGAPALHLRWTF